MRQYLFTACLVVLWRSVKNLCCNNSIITVAFQILYLFPRGLKWPKGKSLCSCWLDNCCYYHHVFMWPSERVICVQRIRQEPQSLSQHVLTSSRLCQSHAWSKSSHFLILTWGPPQLKESSRLLRTQTQWVSSHAEHFWRMLLIWFSDRIRRAILTCTWVLRSSLVNRSYSNCSSFMEAQCPRCKQHQNRCHV